MFTENLINYSQEIIPLIKGYQGNIEYRTTPTLELDGNQYTIEAFVFYSNFADGRLITEVQYQIPYIIKIKNKEIYVIFYIEESGANVYLSNKPNWSGTYRSIYGGTGSLYRNSKMSIILTDGYIFLYSSRAGGVGINIKQFENAVGGEFDSDGLFSPLYGNASDTGGYSGGSFDNSSDIIEIPIKPTIGVSNIGFINVYCPSQNALVNLGSELFPDFTPPPTPPTSTDVAEALQMGLNNVVENISNFTNMFINSKLIDYVIDCHCIPVQPTLTESENIKIGFKSFTPTAPKTTVDYVDFDCGTLSISEYYSNFIDYVGTRAKLYLPFVGFVPIENEYFQNGLLQVIYRFNIIDGSFMAFVLSSSSKSELSNSVIASYGGNACVHIPITGLNYSNMVSGIASGTVSSIAQVGKGHIGSALNSAMETLSNKPQMQSSNGYNSTSAYLGIRYPYLIIEREVSNFSELYNNENGLPCNITKQISELSGFIQMDNCHMETLPCMEEEKEMIQSLLSSGIIV